MSKKLEEELKDAVDGMTERVNRAIETLPQGSKETEKRNGLIQESIKNRRADLEKEFRQRYEDLKNTNDKILTDSLKNQLERHQETLQTKVDQKEKEAEEKLRKMVADRVAFERNLMKHQLNEMEVKLKLVEDKLVGQMKSEREIKRAQELWAAGSALLAATKRGENYVKVDKELKAIENASEGQDQLVTTVLKAIPESVKETGIVPESVLKARYYQMEKIALKVALVDEGGAPLPIYFLSWLQSFFLFMKLSGIPQQEFDKPPAEPSEELDTFDLLQRARFWMERGNLAAAIRHVSLLEGASRGAALSWYNAARAHLEARQAAEAVLAHAAAMGLQYM